MKSYFTLIYRMLIEYICKLYKNNYIIKFQQINTTYHR